VAKNIAIGALAKRGKLELTWAGKSSLIELEETFTLQWKVV